MWESEVMREMKIAFFPSAFPLYLFHFTFASILSFLRLLLLCRREDEEVLSSSQVKVPLQRLPSFLHAES